MKKLLFLLVFSCTFQWLDAKELIQFSDASWSDVGLQATKEKKYVFLDCYTDWCYWCKVMDKEAFVDTSVTNFINKNFIPTRREMEKDPEGIALCMKYHVNGFPTYMIFGPDGNLVYKIIGYRKPDEFLKELKTALTMTAPLVPGFSTALDPGFPDFYKESFGTNKKRKIPEQKTVIAFLDKQKDLFSEVSWAVMWRFGLNEKYENWIFDNKKGLFNLYGKEEVDDKMVSIIWGRVEKAGDANDNEAFKAAMTLVEIHVPEQYTYLNLQMSLSFFEKTKNWKEYGETMQNYVNANGYTDEGMINGVAWNVYEKCDDKGVVAMATVWMDSVCAHSEQYAYEDTYASLLYKDQQYAKAEEVALHAIDLGKEVGEDVSATEALLANIRLKIK